MSIFRMLEELFEAHGDILALQYGGSQMVHRYVYIIERSIFELVKQRIKIGFL